MLEGAYSLIDLDNMTDYEFNIRYIAFKEIRETEKIAMQRLKAQKGEGEIGPIILPHSRFNVPTEDSNEDNRSRQLNINEE